MTAPAMLRSAELSPCGLYRYRLVRSWSSLAAPATLVWVMLNPSTADADRDDPTVRRCLDFARRWGYGALEVVNLFALRATDPRDLRSHYHAAAREPANEEAIAAACRGRDVMAAWGRLPFPTDRDQRVVELLAGLTPGPISIRCLGYTSQHHPRHPLMCPAATTAVQYRPWSQP